MMYASSTQSSFFTTEVRLAIVYWRMLEAVAACLAVLLQQTVLQQELSAAFRKKVLATLC